MQVYFDKRKQANEQPWHIDGCVPWLELPNGQRWTPLGAVLQATEGPMTKIGSFIPDYWDHSSTVEPATAAKQLNTLIRRMDRLSLNDKRNGEPMNVRAAGNLVLFPMGNFLFSFFFFFFFFFFFRLQRFIFYFF